MYAISISGSSALNNDAADGVVLVVMESLPLKMNVGRSPVWVEFCCTPVLLQRIRGVCKILPREVRQRAEDARKSALTTAKVTPAITGDFGVVFSEVISPS